MQIHTHDWLFTLSTYGGMLVLIGWMAVGQWRRARTWKAAAKRLKLRSLGKDDSGLKGLSRGLGNPDNGRFINVCKGIGPSETVYIADWMTERGEKDSSVWRRTVCFVRKPGMRLPKVGIDSEGDSADAVLPEEVRRFFTERESEHLQALGQGDVLMLFPDRQLPPEKAAELLFETLTLASIWSRGS
ncbi:MAG: hypothetical protein WC728_06420 [Elusimicrobiota bacterium]